MAPASGLVLAAVVAAALRPSDGALSHLRRQPGAAGAAPASPLVGAAQVGTAGGTPIETVGRVLANATGNGKMLMSPTDLFRMMMCWGRPKLLDHEKCCDWMPVVCRNGTTGQGYCSRTRKWASEQCENGEASYKERACLFASKMGAKVRVTASLDLPDAETLGGNVTLGGNATLGDNFTAAPTNATQAIPKEASASKSGNSSEKGALPEQGFDEHSQTWVKHVDMKSGTGDWGAEWPMSDETEGQSTARICREQPGHPWCKLYLRDREWRKRVPPLDAPGAPAIGYPWAL